MMAGSGKDDGRQRPLGIATLEDKIVQQAVVTVLNLIYEEEFQGFSYGFRPGRNQHQALDALHVGLRRRRINWVLDCDIRGFFDNVKHEWMLQFVGHRIADPRMLRLIQKWLKAGVIENEDWTETEAGTPQGAVVSPLLANVYLHHVFDLWVSAWRRKCARGDMMVVRYADDIVIGFQHRAGGGTVLEGTRESGAEVRVGTTSGKDATDRVWTIREGEPGKAWRGKAGNILVPGVHALLRGDLPGRVLYGAAEDDRQTSASEASRDRGRATEALARVHCSYGQVVAVGGPRLFPIPRGTGELRGSKDGGSGGDSRLAACATATQST